ncbi:ABC transporter substrate-binding protein [Paracraurococcus lichenis]|uniref:ABC transporter substrate-binding protein n=1 Tax=Paracraurococcus lichenis TaxID=3064888 RepID=A0ABT9E7P5_9PROT|nr:ABC transporter substrate-binding protein [Paracraurococcus sp. LOR1-02]MDO9712137.1 ABC transporter substrate-binding protein [Paracraurococcus sp. LOR1-02]
MRLRFGLILAALLAAGPGFAQGLRIGLQEDPDALDPMLGTTFVGRIVFAALCDKLVDLDRDLNYVPQLATSWDWGEDGRTLTLRLRDGVVFHDGEPLDAEAVRFNLDRYRSTTGSRRLAELRPVQAVEVVDPMTVRIRMAQPYAPLLGVLSDRAGMMLSPKAVQAAGARVADSPVCSGPFRFVRRVPQDRILLERFERYWNAGAVHLQQVTYLPIPAANVRLANLRAGALDMMERIAPTDLKEARAQRGLRVAESVALGYYTMSINVANGPRAKGPLGTPKVREALEAAIDRRALNQVVFEGEFVPSNQAQAPGSTFYNADRPVPPRDLAKAKRLLAEAGMPKPAFTLLVANTPVDQQVAEVIQAMAAEAGFEIRVQTLEAGALTAATERGDYDAAIVLWSGRADPDANVSIWLQSDGFINWGRYANPDFDRALAEARSVTDTAARQAAYRKASAIYLEERPHLFLYHYKLFWGMSDRVSGFQSHPDGLIRLQGVRLGR